MPFVCRAPFKPFASMAMRLTLSVSALAGVATMVFCATEARAADLPGIKSGGDNMPAACVTPGRLQAYLQRENPKLDPRFATIAVDYMKAGEAMGIRWDFAFFQMMRETGALSWERNARFKADPDQNNFAGLKPIGSGSNYESFPDVATGVRAHLEHLMFYAGEKVASPASQRTRKQQEMGALDGWQKSLGHPVTFDDLSAKWTDGSKTYAHLLEKIADTFTNDFCEARDPHPELLAMVHPSASTQPAAPLTAPARTADTAPPATPVVEKLTGSELARRALADDGKRSALGANGGEPPKVKMLNAAEAPSTMTVPSEPAGAVAAATSAPEAAKPAEPTKVAALGTQTKAMATPQKESTVAPDPGAKAAAGKCRVWTASYGGHHAVIVKSVIDQVANFTVLDVNEGQEAREAEAFISAYAKGGTVAGEFPSQDKALEKAFELCPEG